MEDQVYSVLEEPTETPIGPPRNTWEPTGKTETILRDGREALSIELVSSKVDLGPSATAERIRRDEPTESSYITYRGVRVDGTATPQAEMGEQLREMHEGREALEAEADRGGVVVVYKPDGPPVMSGAIGPTDQPHLMGRLLSAPAAGRAAVPGLTEQEHRARVEAFRAKNPQLCEVFKLAALVEDHPPEDLDLQTRMANVDTLVADDVRDALEDTAVAIAKNTATLRALRAEQIRCRAELTVLRQEIADQRAALDLRQNRTVQTIGEAA